MERGALYGKPGVMETDYNTQTSKPHRPLPRRLARRVQPRLQVPGSAASAGSTARHLGALFVAALDARGMFLRVSPFCSLDSLSE